MIAHLFTSIGFNRRRFHACHPLFAGTAQRKSGIGSEEDPTPDFLFSVFSSACAVSENSVRKEKKTSCGAKKHML